MAFHENFYFLAPVTGLPPRGPIRLGSLVSHPRLVTAPLNAYPLVPSSSAEQVYIWNTSNEEITLEKSESGHVGIFAQFLQSIGISGNVEGQISKMGSETWSFVNLSTIWFTPSDNYVRDALLDVDVQDFIYTHRPWLGTKKVYMITGVKIAYVSRSTISYLRSKAGNLQVGFDFTPLGAPINVGPDIRIQRELNVKQTANSTDPFVFAFRLRRVKIFPSGDFKHKDYKTGTLLSVQSESKDELEPKVEIVVDGLEECDADADEFGLPSTNVMNVDDDEKASEKTTCKVSKANW
jgi:hypothetical protein